MEDRRPAKNFKTDYNLQNKLIIVNIFDETINQVDIDAETILIRINRNDDIKQSIEEINQSRQLLINKIKEIKNANLDNFNKATYTNEHPLEVTKDNLFVKYCLYLNSDTVRSFTFNKDRLGILLVTDFYIDEMQAKKLE